MTIAAGTRLGPYEITAKLGEGGMGEVYRATDTKLKREVAIKVLPAAFTEDRERLARFEREAQLLAQLHHPNIASIFGLEESDGTRALVMELVDGPTLAERLEQGPLPFNECLSVSLQIAHALEEAHEKGIVHRDLKPQNIKASHEGKVKVLDFGLAKAMDSGFASPADLAHSPTMTFGGTREGVILGTAAYMAPEQARGGAVDRRADIWAFGVVLYEMLSGERLFAEGSVVDTLSAVMRKEIDVGRLPVGLPPAIRRLVARCLERDPKRRLRDIGDARLVLEDLAAGRDEPAAPAALARAEAPAAPSSRGRWVAGAALLVLGLAGGWAVARSRSPAAPEADFHLVTLESGFVHSARWASDGVTLVFGEAREGRPVALFTTRSDATSSRALDLPPADVVGIAANGEMALILDRHHAGSWLRVGTLAQTALAGGAPRPLLENVFDADISPDGARFAVVRAEGAIQRLEYPIGTPIFTTAGWISSPRISRDGRRVAFADHPLWGDDQGRVAVVEPGGEPQRLSEPLNFLHGIAWSADGTEVWATHGSSDMGSTLSAFPITGRSRTLLRTMSLTRLHDVGTNGAVLLTADSMPVSIEGRLASGPTDFPVGSLSGVTIGGVSEDGKLVLATSGGQIEEGEYRSFYRRDGDDRDTFLGPGAAGGLSPDGRWAYLFTLQRDRSKIRVVPIGAGEVRVIDLGEVEHQTAVRDLVSLASDGRRIGFLGRRGGEEPRGYVLDLEAGKPPRAATPPGVRYVRLSPDGAWMAGTDPSGRLALFDTASGARREIPGAAVDELAVAWSSGSDALFVWDLTIPARVERLELATGRRELAFEWKPGGGSQGLYGLITVTNDARYFVMRYRRGVSSLAVARGIR